jgi:hypothetical protein
VIRSDAKLRTSAGWFAAGIEVQRAATLLSDGAFKLFVWLCLHAERGRGCLSVSVSRIAAVLHKTEEQVQAYLLELCRVGVCQRGPTNLIIIRDSFWPYTRPEASVSSETAAAYVAEVKRTFLARRCVSSAFTPADDRIAAEWHRGGVPLECIERAILLGCLRKHASLINHRSGTPITTLGYFRSLIGEVSASSASADYWRYVRMRLADLERRWPQHAHCGTEETK